MAAIALHFIVGSGHLHNFEDSLACFELDVLPASVPSFATREPAQDWLKQTPASVSIPGVTVAGSRYSVGYSLDEGVRFLIRVPSREELSAEWPDADALLASSVSSLLRAGARVTSAEERESIQVILLALRFIRESGQSSDLERFVGVFDTRETFLPLRVFASRAEAEVWLNGHPRPPHGARIQIADQRFSVGYERGSHLRVLVRGPSLKEVGLSESSDEPGE